MEILTFTKILRQFEFGSDFINTSLFLETRKLLSLLLKYLLTKMSALLSDVRNIYLIANKGHVSGLVDRRNFIGS